MEAAEGVPGWRPVRSAVAEPPPPDAPRAAFSSRVGHPSVGAGLEGGAGRAAYVDRSAVRAVTKS